MDSIGDFITLGSGRRRRLFWQLQFCGWAALGMLITFFAVNSYFGFVDALCLGAFRGVLGFSITCILWLGYRRMRLNRSNFWPCGVYIFLACCVAGTTDGLLTRVFVEIVGIDLERTGAREFMALAPFVRSLLYLFWSVLYFGIGYWLDTQQTQLRLAQAQVAARTSELKALRAQINPHFLFNALGSILAQAENPSFVREITFALSDYLRFSLQRSGELEPLGGELKALENYLQVEKARFEEDLEYYIDADEQARGVCVPNAIIQPLLENAIKYGQRSAIRPLRVSIRASVEDGALFVAVKNTGDWIKPEHNKSSKIGLSNLRCRLRLLYEDKATLHIESEAGSVCVKMRLPLEAALESDRA